MASYGQPIRVDLDTWHEGGLYPLITPLTDGELASLVPPESTRATGMNCAVLSLYTCGLVPADVAKYYSDKLTISIPRASSQVSPQRSFNEILVINEKFNEALSKTYRHINTDNLTNIHYEYNVNFSAVNSLLYIFDRMPVGYAVPLAFGKPDRMQSGSGSHAIAFWKRDETSAYLIDIQRGVLTAGGQMFILYNEWRKGGGLFGNSIAFFNNAFAVVFHDPRNATRASVMRGTFIEYMIRQGRAWNYYDPAVPDDSIEPKIGILMGTKPRSFVRTIPSVYKIPHNNENLRRNVYTPEFENYTKDLMDIDTPETFASDLEKLPILHVIGVNRPGVFRQYDVIEGNPYYNYINPHLPGGRRINASSRRLLSGPRRTFRRSASSRARGYTRRRRALRSGKAGYPPKVTGRKA
jgi:hypothetical protein